MSARDSMDIDQEPPANSGSSTPPQAASAQANFAVPIPNGTTYTEGDTAPVPPPHKSNPSSPQPTSAEEAESYKAAGNRFFKEKNYGKAIEQYSKGDFFSRVVLRKFVC
jgi:DnaJ homolog subfamily C member 7